MLLAVALFLRKKNIFPVIASLPYFFENLVGFLLTIFSFLLVLTARKHQGKSQKKLLDDGIITEEEFEKKKKALLDI